MLYYMSKIYSFITEILYILTDISSSFSQHPGPSTYHFTTCFSKFNILRFHMWDSHNISFSVFVSFYFFVLCLPCLSLWSTLRGVLLWWRIFHIYIYNLQWYISYIAAILYQFYTNFMYTNLFFWKFHPTTHQKGHTPWSTDFIPGMQGSSR
jgi:hypothetical protein